jgi:hypothetical protein
MASSYSPTLRLELIGTGEQSGIWGDTTNSNLGSLLEQAITGVQNIPISDANYTLTALNGSVDQARNAVLIITSIGDLTETRNIIIPSAEKIYIVKNSTSGAQSITVKTSGGTGFTVPNGQTALIYCDGTNCAQAITTANNISLTGVPTAPTAPNGTTTTQIATCEYVSTNGIPVGGTGFGVRTGPSSTALRSINAGTGIAISNGDGVADNPSVSNTGTLSINLQTGAHTINGANGIQVATVGSTTTIQPTSLSFNSFGARTVSSAAPSGGNDGDIWYQI